MEVSRERIGAAASEVYERTRALLGADTSAGACLTLSAELAAELAAEFARVSAAGAAPECRAGCAFCCHQRVSLLPYEALALWQAWQQLPARERDAVERRVRENAARIDALTVTEHYAANIPCALLSDGRCSVYAARPSICASFHSMSRARCEYSFNHPQGIGTPRNSRPVLLELQAFADALIAAAQAGLAAAGLDGTKLELHQALRVLLDDPQAAARWRGGGALQPTTLAD